MTSDLKKCFVEFLGTFFVAFTLLCCLLLVQNHELLPAAVGLMLIAAIYMGGSVSGAQYNPAVSLSVFLSGRMGGQKTFLYCIFQCLGAAYATLMILLFAKYFVATSMAQYEITPLIIAELIFTVIYMCAYLFTFVSKKAKDNNYYGLAIGSTSLVGSYAVGSICVATFNPAITLSLLILRLIPLNIALITITVQLVAAIIAAFLFRKLNIDDVEDVEIVKIDEFIRK